MAKLNARSHRTGRKPTLRNDIVEFLKTQNSAMTALDISIALGLHKSAPYRPLNELVSMGLVIKALGVDGAEFSLDKKYYEYLKVTEPRRVQE
jgi:predicted transcriptional regulator